MVGRNETIDYNTEITITDERIKIGAIVYYAQCLNSCGVFEVLELKVRTVEDTWFTGTENKTKHAYLFSYKDIGETVFFDRKDALDAVKEAEKNCNKKISKEKYYEEY